MKKPVAFLAILVPMIAAAADTSVPVDESGACLAGPLEQFGRYLGNWNIEDSQLSDDGSEWLPGDGAQWNFVCIGNGTAIQDFWIPTGGGVGTNLRTYNAETKSWDIAWTFTGMAGFAHIQAKEDDSGNIVMQYKNPLPDPLRRITFFPPTENGWNWKLEVSSDSGETWLEVYRISATRAGSG